MNKFPCYTCASSVLASPTISVVFTNQNGAKNSGHTATARWFSGCCKSPFSRICTVGDACTRKLGTSSVAPKSTLIGGTCFLVAVAVGVAGASTILPIPTFTAAVTVRALVGAR